jgi:hypothetical protein
MKSLVADHIITSGTEMGGRNFTTSRMTRTADTAYVADDHHMLAWLRAFIERILDFTDRRTREPCPDL